ncbi:MAG: hypothetical protein H6740_25230 [Alphaproteobacteria bacterium]|nr:hypothetical protein [Alphaproteobacteria bacterium]
MAWVPTASTPTPSPAPSRATASSCAASSPRASSASSSPTTCGASSTPRGTTATTPPTPSGAWLAGLRRAGRRGLRRQRRAGHILERGSERFISTPELSFSIRHLGAQGGLNVSASHNPRTTTAPRSTTPAAAGKCPPTTRLVSIVEQVKLGAPRELGAGLRRQPRALPRR